MFKKEDSFKYFFGGTAVGVTAGLVVGKLLLPSINIGTTGKNESGSFTKQNQAGYLRDDNALHPGKHTTYQPRSKSASRYEDKKLNNASSFIVPLKKSFQSDSTVNNFTPSSESKIYQDKDPESNKECDNCMSAKCKADMSDKKSSYYSKFFIEYTKDDNDQNSIAENTLYKHVSNISNLQQGDALENDINNLSKTQTNFEKKMNIECRNIIKKTTQNMYNNDAKTSLTAKGETFINTPYADFFPVPCDIANINSENLEFQILYDNISNIATCNTIIGIEDEDTFNENNLISSTRYES